MSYTKNTWTNGDVITKEKLDNIENGIYGNAVTQVDVSGGVATFKNAADESLFTLTLPSGSSYTLIGEGLFTVNTASTTAVTVGSITANPASAAWTSANLILVSVRDTAGKRNGYFLGTDYFFANPNPANESATANISNSAKLIYRVASTGKYEVGNSATTYGVYAYDVANTGVIRIYARYNSTNSFTINGTFKVAVYALKFPNDTSPLA